MLSGGVELCLLISIFAQLGNSLSATLHVTFENMASQHRHRTSTRIQNGVVPKFIYSPRDDTVSPCIMRARWLVLRRHSEDEVSVEGHLDIPKKKYVVALCRLNVLRTDSLVEVCWLDGPSVLIALCHENHDPRAVLFLSLIFLSWTSLQPIRAIGPLSADYPHPIISLSSQSGAPEILHLSPFIHKSMTSLLFLSCDMLECSVDLSPL